MIALGILLVILWLVLGGLSGVVWEDSPIGAVGLFILSVLAGYFALQIIF